jgi:hypothetical protein
MAVMNFEDWTVDLNTASATHACGFRVEVEGSLKEPSEVNPGRFPKELDGLAKVRLLRCGVDAIIAAAKQQKAAPAKKLGLSDAEKKAFANQPKRPKLSLKKKKEG